jgi:putative methionine-R-sulfoxide reductase with GAF domain
MELIVQVVPDVHQFPGHIACDSASNSEIVVPLFGESGEVVGVLDLDSVELNTFDLVDKAYLEQIGKLGILSRERSHNIVVTDSCDLSSLQ